MKRSISQQFRRDCTRCRCILAFIIFLINSWSFPIYSMYLPHWCCYGMNFNIYSAYFIQPSVHIVSPTIMFENGMRMVKATHYSSDAGEASHNQPVDSLERLAKKCHHNSAYFCFPFHMATFQWTQCVAATYECLASLYFASTISYLNTQLILIQWNGT